MMELWHELLNTLPDQPDGALTEHTLDRLIELHGPDSEFPDVECLSKSLIARARMEYHFEDSLPYFNRTLAHWDWERLIAEVKWIENYRDIPESLTLFCDWLDIHPGALAYEPVLDYLGDNFDTLISRSGKPFTLDFHHIEPQVIAGNSKLSGYYLKLICSSHSNLKDKRQWSLHELKFLCCVDLAGNIDKDTYISLKIGNTLCKSEEREWQIISREYGDDFIEILSSGRHSRLFMNYEPLSLKAFERWLSVFSPTHSISSATHTRLSEVVLSMMEFSLKKDRFTLEQFITLCVHHKLTEIIHKFHFVKTIVEIIKTAEVKTQIHEERQLAKSHLAALVKSVSHKNSNLYGDVLIVLLKMIRLKTKKTWLTPLRLLVQELVRAGRIDEAQRVAAENNGTVGKNMIPVDEFIAGFKGIKRQIPSYDSLIVTIATLFMDNWKFSKTEQ